MTRFNSFAGLAVAGVALLLDGCGAYVKTPGQASDAAACANACKSFDKDGQCVAYREDIPQQCAEHFARICVASPESCPKGNAYALVRVWYATDRARVQANTTSIAFGAERSPVSYGQLDVSIPATHRLGDLESPSALRLEFATDPARHVVLHSVTSLPAARFFDELGSRIQSSGTRDALVFLHGYNVTFDDAARRTAQLTYDLKFPGAPIFYSWPSVGLTGAYTLDEQSIEWSQTHIKQFLADLLSNTSAERVYLIAHSMGNRALTRAFVALLRERSDLQSRVRQIVLAAPDIDAEVFARDLAPALVSSGVATTLYASADDKALLASKAVHGYARAGDGGPRLLVIPGIETVDATGADTSFISHSYFANRTILSDLFYLVSEGKPADSRFGLRRVVTPQGPYWVYAP
jgi:esterase/lipase superfamily enzyme